MRFAWVAIFFCVWVGAIGARLVWLQVIHHPEWVDKAKRQQHNAYEVAPQRGVLYDRNLRELAMTVQVDSIYVDPTELGENRADAAEMLAKVVHTDPDRQLHLRAANAGAVQRLERLCLGGAEGRRGDARTACAS